VSRRTDITSLIAGACIAALGVLLLLDAQGTVHLDFGVFGPAVCAAIGAILLASGLSRPR
jgi:hypothetical protein